MHLDLTAYSRFLRFSTKGVIDTRVEVNGHNVHNSPMKIQLVSTRPERTRTEVYSLGSNQRGDLRARMKQLESKLTIYDAGVVPAATSKAADDSRGRRDGGAAVSNSEQHQRDAEEEDKDVFGGVGLRSAIAGQPTSILLRLRDEFGNPATPLPGAYKIDMAFTESRALHANSATTAATAKQKVNTSLGVCVSGRFFRISI